MTTLYVGNLDYATSNDDLQELFARFGPLISARVMTDRETGRPRGFGFVQMSQQADAELAVRTLHETLFNGRRIVVNEARAKAENVR